MPISHQLVELAEKRHLRLQRVAKAGIRTAVAGGPARIGHYQQRICIAVGTDGLQLKHIARGLALGPQALFAAAEKSDLSAL